MKLTSTQKGELFILSNAILSGFFPIATKLSFNALDPLFSAAITTLFAAALLAVVLTVQKRWSELKIRAAWLNLLLVTLIIAVAYYGILFIGMQKTSANDASVIILMEIFFSFLVLNLWKKEPFKWHLLWGALLMSAGALLILFKGTLHLNLGNLIILAAVAIPPVGNYFAQQARKYVSSITVIFVRSFFGGLILLLISFLAGGSHSLPQLQSSLIPVIFNGIVVFGFCKILWLEGIHRVPITKGVPFIAISPAFTLFFSYFILHEIPSRWQFLGFIPIAAGLLLLTDLKKTFKEPEAESITP